MRMRDLFVFIFLCYFCSQDIFAGRVGDFFKKYCCCCCMAPVDHVDVVACDEQSADGSVVQKATEGPVVKVPSLPIPPQITETNASPRSPKSPRSGRRMSEIVEEVNLYASLDIRAVPEKRCMGKCIANEGKELFGLSCCPLLSSTIPLFCKECFDIFRERYNGICPFCKNMLRLGRAPIVVTAHLPGVVEE
jgi:hypothetical protein